MSVLDYTPDEILLQLVQALEHTNTLLDRLSDDVDAYDYLYTEDELIVDARRERGYKLYKINFVYDGVQYILRRPRNYGA